MRRIFLALPLNDFARSMLDGLGCTVQGARPVPASQLHCTIRFIGEVDGCLYNDIRDQLQTLMSPPVRISIEGVGHFPPRGAPRVLWAGIEPTDELNLLRNRVNRILKQCSVLPEKRKFHPHVTLARLNNCSPSRVARFLTDTCSLEIPPFNVNRLSLLSSILSPKGAIHTIEQEYPLTDGRTVY